jgi:hypothetical protein
VNVPRKEGERRTSEGGKQKHTTAGIRRWLPPTTTNLPIGGLCIESRRESRDSTFHPGVPLENGDSPILLSL